MILLERLQGSEPQSALTLVDAMSSTLLERTRALEEDIDQYEDACAELLVEDATRVRPIQCRSSKARANSD